MLSDRIRQTSIVDLFSATTRHIIKKLAASHAACPMVYNTKWAELTALGHFRATDNSRHPSRLMAAFNALTGIFKV